MKRRIVELENGKFSYQYRLDESKEWTLSTTIFKSHKEVKDRLLKWNAEENMEIKKIHEEI